MVAPYWAIVCARVHNSLSIRYGVHQTSRVHLTMILSLTYVYPLLDVNLQHILMGTYRSSGKTSITINRSKFLHRGVWLTVNRTSSAFSHHVTPLLSLESLFRKTQIITQKKTVQPGDAFEDTVCKPGFEFV
jgi:hypothetical protein